MTEAIVRSPIFFHQMIHCAPTLKEEIATAAGLTAIPVWFSGFADFLIKAIDGVLFSKAVNFQGSDGKGQ